MEQKTEKKMGWEIAREVEKDKPTMGDRAIISGEKWRTLIKYAVLYVVLFIAATWLAGNPFEWTQRIPSSFVSVQWIGRDRQLDHCLVGGSSLRYI